CRFTACRCLAFAALTAAWTWPLARHLGDALPGDPGDNYSYLWNLWWMRQARSTAGLTFFRTTYLFYPFGTALVDHSHSAPPAFIAATILRPLSIVTAQNVMLLALGFINLAATYALAWSATRRVGAYIAYYYVVYLAVLTIVYIAATRGLVTAVW